MRLTALFIICSLVSFAQDTLYNKAGEPEYVKFIKPPEPPVIVYDSVDNKDAEFTYAGSWYNGNTTATGFYKNTMAYSNVSGNTATIQFNGTSIEVFCEKKVGHGSAAFQVDSQTPVTVPLGVVGPVGSTSVFKAENLTNEKHTFTLTISGGGNVVFDYVTVNGTAIVPTPPVTDAIFLMPGVSMKGPVESATSGTKFQLGNGVYPENIVNVPAGVTILPPTSGTAYIDYTGGTIAPGGSLQAIFQLSSDTKTNGNQTISGFTIRGAYRTNGGIYVKNRDNVVIKNVKIQECTFFGMWLQNSTVEVANSELVNTSWGSSGWCSGEINVTENTKFNIHHNLFRNDHRNAQGVFDKGYGIKGLKWNSVEGRFNGVIEYNTFELGASSTWNGSMSPNIDIEFESVYVVTGNVTIQHNNLKNMASMAGHRTTGNTGIWIVQNNTFNLQSGSTCVIESACNNLRVLNNIMRGAPMMSANYNNTRYNDQLFEGNDFVSNNANPGWGGTIYIGSAGVDNFVYKNNKITTGPTSPGGFQFIKYAGVQCCVTNGGGNTIN